MKASALSSKLIRVLVLLAIAIVQFGLFSPASPVAAAAPQSAPRALLAASNSDVLGTVYTNMGSYTIALYQQQWWGWEFKYQRFYRGNLQPFVFYDLAPGKYMIKITTYLGWKQCSPTFSLDGINSKVVNCVY